MYDTSTAKGNSHFGVKFRFAVFSGGHFCPPPVHLLYFLTSCFISDDLLHLLSYKPKNVNLFSAFKIDHFSCESKLFKWRLS